MVLPTLDIISQQAKLALAEDVGDGDISAQLIPEEQILETKIISREPAILAGQHWVNAVFDAFDSSIQVTWHKHDSQALEKNDIVCEISGSARDILTAERTALNFLQLLSGTATLVRHYVDIVADLPVRLLDTRKTIPGLRAAQKYAVTCGGAHNHRHGLFDAIMLKENHLAAGNGDIVELVQRARRLNPDILVIVEVENLKQLETAVQAKADKALLDNFDLNQLEIAAKTFSDTIRLEASGNITEDSLRKVAATGVHDISIGALTKKILPIDFSMLWQ